MKIEFNGMSLEPDANASKSVGIYESLYTDPQRPHDRMSKACNLVFYSAGDHGLAAYSDEWLGRYLSHRVPVTVVIETKDPNNPWIFIPEAPQRQ